MVNIKTDSRKVKKGDIFVALRGIVGDGHDFIPQAIKNVLPALGNEFITLVKESSIISVIGVQELMFRAGIVRTSIMKAFEPYIAAAIMYLIITTVLSWLVGLLEKKLAQSN